MTCIPDPNWDSQGGCDPLPGVGEEYDGVERLGPKEGTPSRPPRVRDCWPYEIDSKFDECKKLIEADERENKKKRHMMCDDHGSKFCCLNGCHEIK